MGKKYEIKLKTGDMYRFLMRHTYTSVSGILSLVLSLLALYLVIVRWNDMDETYQALLIIVAAYGPVFQPIWLYNRAKKQMAAPAFAKPICYQFEEEGVIVSQDEEEGVIPWTAVRKVVRTKKYIYMYLDKKRCYIYPREQMQGDADAVADYIDAKKGVGR